MLQSEIQNLILRERQLTEEFSMGGQNNEKLEEMKFGLKMYETEIDRLNRIVQ